jgi:hypothetical protein
MSGKALNEMLASNDKLESRVVENDERDLSIDNKKKFANELGLSNADISELAKKHYSII